MANAFHASFAFNFKTTCQAIFDRYLTTGTAQCRSVYDQSFNGVLSGDGLAVWDGVPAPNQTDQFQKFPQPVIDDLVSFFRSDDLIRTADVELPRVKRTTLELSITHAFERLVASGFYHSWLDGLSDMETTTYCLGGYENWPLPEVTPGTDLEKILERGEFICGYPQGFVGKTSNGEVTINTTDPKNVAGAIPNFYAALTSEMGKFFNRTVVNTWKTFRDSQATLEVSLNLLGGAN